MSVSAVWKYLEDSTHTDQQKIDYLKTDIDNLSAAIMTVRNALADSEINLNEIMDANGNNSEEHYAKTMMLYGRKFCGRDVITGITGAANKDIYKYAPSAANPPFTKIPYINDFQGIDTFLPTYSGGDVTITWDCMDGMAGIYKASGEPVTQAPFVQKHCLGTVVVMPTIKNLNVLFPNGNLVQTKTNTQASAGTNNYKLKSGFAINGWKIKQPSAAAQKIYLFNDLGNEYKYQENGTQNPSKIEDKRIFEFSDRKPADVPQAQWQAKTSTTFKLPSKVSLLPTSKAITFILDVIKPWFTIDFPVRHSISTAGSPVDIPIKTQYDKVITLPIASNIQMEPGWEIDPSGIGGQYGTFTTVDPNTGVDQVDPDGDPIAEMEFKAGESYIVGTDMDAGIRHLYLKVRQA